MNDTLKLWYASLKKHNPDAYRKAVQYASGIGMRHGLGAEKTAQVEASLVMFACELLDLKPQP